MMSPEDTASEGSSPFEPRPHEHGPHKRVRNTSLEDTAHEPRNEEGVARKRVCRACDACRVKKAKCDGQTHCARCVADNRICQYTNRKKSHDKTYSPEAVEIIVRERKILESIVRVMYRRIKNREGLPEALEEQADGFPLTQAIAESLGIMHQQEDLSDDPESPEPENPFPIAGGNELLHVQNAALAPNFHSRRASARSPSTQNYTNAGHVEGALEYLTTEAGGLPTPFTVSSQRYEINPYHQSPTVNPVSQPLKLSPHSQPMLNPLVPAASSLSQPGWPISITSPDIMSNFNYTTPQSLESYSQDLPSSGGYEDYIEQPFWLENSELVSVNPLFPR